MSLINEALKKAQREREEPADKPSVPLGGAVQKPANPAQTRSFKTVHLAIGATIAIALLFSAGAFLMVLLKQVQRPQETPAPDAPTEVAAHIQTTPPPAPEAPRRELPPQSLPNLQPTAEAPQSPLTPAPEPAPVAAPEPALVAVAEPDPEPVAAQPAPEPVAAQPAPVAEPEPALVAVAEPDPEPVAAQPAPEPVAQPAPEPALVAAQPAPQQPAQRRGMPEVVPPDPAPLPVPNRRIQPDPNAISVLQDARITGVKVAGANSLVLMNNRIFQIGSVVSHQPRLRISRILNTEIYFIDESGAEYRKQFR